MANVQLLDRAELAEQGFTVVRGVLAADVCRRARDLMDDYLGPAGASVESHVNARGWELNKQYNNNPRADASDANFWATAPPFLQSNGYRHDIRHPIREPLMAELVTSEMVAVFRQALRSADVKLQQQFLVRTDYQPPPYSKHPGWHIDHPCLNWQLDATPSQHYYSAMVALAPVPAGCANFTVAAGSLRRARAFAARLAAEEPEWCIGLRDIDIHSVVKDRVRCGALCT
jgi:hypothetical protein